MATLQAELHIPEGFRMGWEEPDDSECDPDGLNLKFWAGNGLTWDLSDQSISEYTPSEWRHLLAEPGAAVVFSDREYATFSIGNKNGNLVFEVDCRGGGKMSWLWPIELCRDAIEHVATRIEIHLAGRAIE